MSRPALLANENVPATMVAALRRAGVTVEWVAESMRAAGDRAVLEHAATRALWLLTFDRDYGELVFARAVRPPAAIVYMRQQPKSPEDLAGDVLALLDEGEFARGHLVVVSSNRRLRRRALPA